MDKTHFVLIHGLASKPKEATLRDRYERSLEIGAGRNIHRDRIHLAYWADLMGYVPPDGPDRDEYAEGGENFEPYTWRERAKFTLSGAVRSRLVDLAEDHLRNSIHDPDQHDNGIQAMLAGVPGIIAGGPAQRVYGSFLPDLHRYFFGNQRDNVLQRLRVQIAAVPDDSEICLIAHSMGSIIAMDLILKGTRNIKTLVTIGSPLGIRVVKEQLGITPEKLNGLSKKIGTWFNHYDRLDIVALDSDLADDYAPMPVEDVRIRNEFVNKDGERNHHKSYGYLRTPEMAEIISAQI
jgi:hypothetical protein